MCSEDLQYYHIPFKAEDKLEIKSHVMFLYIYNFRRPLRESSGQKNGKDSKATWELHLLAILQFGCTLDRGHFAKI